MLFFGDYKPLAKRVMRESAHCCRRGADVLVEMYRAAIAQEWTVTSPATGVTLTGARCWSTVLKFSAWRRNSVP